MTFKKVFALFTALCVFISIEAIGQAVHIELVTKERDADFGSIRISLRHSDIQSCLSTNQLEPSQWKKILTVYPLQKPATNYESLPPMLGKYVAKEHILIFQPRFPFIEGRTYQVKFDFGSLKKICPRLSKHSPLIQKQLTIPYRQKLSAPKVLAVYPSSESIPINQLKWYIHFSTSMQFGEAYQHIRLENEQGQIVAAPFLELEHELWDKAQMRLTLWMDPGRIKRDLIPNREMGLPLEEGQKYRLIIDQKWKAKNGKMLEKSWVKSFKVSQADRVKPDPANWSILPPKPGTSGPLQVNFPEPMDQALLHSQIVVYDPEGNLLNGTVTLGKEEKQWQFIPVSLWKKGIYHLKIGTDLEDLAGNNLNRLFDTDLKKDAASIEKQSFRERRFQIGENK